MKVYIVCGTFGFSQTVEVSNVFDSQAKAEEYVKRMNDEHLWVEDWEVK